MGSCHVAEEEIGERDKMGKQSCGKRKGRKDWS